MKWNEKLSICQNITHSKRFLTYTQYTMCGTSDGYRMIRENEREKERIEQKNLHNFFLKWLLVFSWNSCVVTKKTIFDQILDTKNFEEKKQHKSSNTHKYIVKILNQQRWNNYNNNDDDDVVERKKNTTNVLFLFLFFFFVVVACLLNFNRRLFIDKSLNSLTLDLIRRFHTADKNLCSLYYVCGVRVFIDGFRSLDCSALCCYNFGVAVACAAVAAAAATASAVAVFDCNTLRVCVYCLHGYPFDAVCICLSLRSEHRW